MKLCTKRTRTAGYRYCRMSRYELLQAARLTQRIRRAR